MKQYNIIPHGNISNNNGILTGFAANTYASLNKIFNPVNNSYEIVFKFNSNNISDEQIIFQCGDLMSSSGLINLEIYESKFYFELDKNGTQTFYFTGSTTLVSQTDYWVKLTFDGTNYYELSLSTDGVNYSVENSTTNSNILGDDANNPSYIGIDRGLTNWYFNGTIDLNESYIKINDNIFWQGVSDVTRIQLRHDTSNNWSTVNPILLEGEVGLELDTGKQKVGDGVTAWNSLNYDYGSTAVQSSNIKTINNTSLLGSGNIDTSEIFVATVGTTNLADITTAYNAGKTIFALEANETLYSLVDYSSSRVDFAYINGTLSRGVYVNSGGWNTNSVTLQTTSNKVTSISGSSTDTQYPSAKCVYDEFADVVRQEISIGGQSTTLYCYSYNDTNIYTFKIPSESFESVTCYNKNCEYIGSGSSNSSNNGIILTIDGVTRTYSRNSTGDHTIMLSTLTDNNSNFLNITQADGQWIGRYSQISTATATGTYAIDLSSYLPDDSYNYEVYLYAHVYSSNSTYTAVYVKTSIFANVGETEGIRIAMVGTNGRQGLINTIVPVGTDHTLTITIKDRKLDNNYIGFCLAGYRRIGTNS